MTDATLALWNAYTVAAAKGSPTVQIDRDTAWALLAASGTELHGNGEAVETRPAREVDWP